jgi:hypothetical protein
MPGRWVVFLPAAAWKCSRRPSGVKVIARVKGNGRWKACSGPPDAEATPMPVSV